MKVETKGLKKIPLALEEVSNKPKLIVTKELKAKIDYLHKKCPGVEWSGELITSEKGTISDLDDWTIKAEDMFLADVGTSGFTGYEVDKGGFKSVDIVEMYDKFPELLEGKKKLHHIHTHHNMRIFFSGTDMENLEDRASVSNYFLMLIVGYNENWIAKVAFKAKKKGSGTTKLSFFNNPDSVLPDISLEKDKESEVLVVMNCSIEIEGSEVPQEFKDRLKKVIEEKRKDEEAARKYPTPYKPQSGYKKEYFQPEFGDTFPRFDSHKKRSDRHISEMTDREWMESQMDTTSYTEKHAIAYLNSLIDGTYQPYDFTDSIPKLKNIDKKCQSKKQVQDFVEKIEEDFQIQYDVCFGGSVDKYVELLEKVEDYLSPHASTRLINELLNCVKEEIDLHDDASLFIPSSNQFIL